MLTLGFTVSRSDPAVPISHASPCLFWYVIWFCRDSTGLWLSGGSPGLSLKMLFLQGFVLLSLDSSKREDPFCFDRFVEGMYILPLLLENSAKFAFHSSLSCFAFLIKTFYKAVLSSYLLNSETTVSEEITNALGFVSNNEIKSFLLWWPSGLQFSFFVRRRAKLHTWGIVSLWITDQHDGKWNWTISWSPSVKCLNFTS